MMTSTSMAVAPSRAPKTSPVSADTRQRLVESAAALFAEHGFENVTVREICKLSRANVAAINYHFGDKAGLYRAVVMHAIAVMQETNEQSQRAGDGQSPEDQIRGFVRVFVGRMAADDNPNAWIAKLMAREMEHPTEALDQVMMQVVQPRLEYLCGVAAAYMKLPVSDPRVKRCIVSLQVQCFMAARRIPPSMEKVWGPVMRDVDVAIDHIVEFTLGGMRAIAAAQ